MESTVASYKGYVIITKCGKEKGIFFRSPIQKVFFDAYYHEAMFSADKFEHAIKNPIRRLYEIFIGNGRIIKEIDYLSQDIDWAGFEGYILCSPIYFKREYRKLEAFSCGYDNIDMIKSHGYESPFNHCAGYCDVEKTVFYLRNKKKINFKTTECYHFTYDHIIKRIIDTGRVKND